MTDPTLPTFKLPLYTITFTDEGWAKLNGLFEAFKRAAEEMARLVRAAFDALRDWLGVCVPIVLPPAPPRALCFDPRRRAMPTPRAPTHTHLTAWPTALRAYARR